MNPAEARFNVASELVFRSGHWQDPQKLELIFVIAHPQPDVDGEAFPWLDHRHGLVGDIGRRVPAALPVLVGDRVQDLGQADTPR
jgi:hypothetical protein